MLAASATGAALQLRQHGRRLQKWSDGLAPLPACAPDLSRLHTVKAREHGSTGAQMNHT